MNYQERVNTRAEVRSLYERVCNDPAVERYRGYTALHSYGWNETAGDCVKRAGEVWFKNPAFDPAAPLKKEDAAADLLDEKLEESERCIERLNAEKSELCVLIDTLNARIAEYEARLLCVTEERDEALRALSALREALAAIRKLTEIK